MRKKKKKTAAIELQLPSEAAYHLKQRNCGLQEAPAPSHQQLESTKSFLDRNHAMATILLALCPRDPGRALSYSSLHKLSNKTLPSPDRIVLSDVWTR